MTLDPLRVSQTWFTGTFRGPLHLSHGTTHGFQFRFCLKPIHSQAMIVRAASVHTVVPWRSTLRLGRWSQRLKIAAGTQGHQLASPAMNPHLFLDGKFRWNAKVVTWWSMWAKLDGLWQTQCSMSNWGLPTFSWRNIVLFSYTSKGSVFVESSGDCPPPTQWSRQQIPSHWI